MPRLPDSFPLFFRAVLLAFGLAVAGASSLPAQQEAVPAPAPTLSPADQLVQAGVKSLSEKNYVQAEEIFRKLAEVEPERFRGSLGLAEAYVGQKKGDEALGVLRAAIQKYPASPELHLAMGNLAMMAANFDAAIAEYQQALDRIDRNSKNAAEIYVRMAGAYNRKGDTDFALNLLRQALKLQPANASLLNASAGLLMVSGQIPAAQAEYRKLLDINPNNGLALNNLAFLTADSDPQLALAYALRARQLAPGEPAVTDTLGWVYLKLKQVDEALTLFREVVGKDPRRVAYRYHLATALEQKGDHEAARKEAEQALQNTPSKEETQEINDLLRKIK